MRTLTAAMIVPLLRVTGYRFDKSFRQDPKGWKYFVWTYCLNTTQANILAGI